jgi:hypothetical protein
MMGVQQNIGIAPMPAVTRVLAQFQPAQLASFIEVAIGLLDLAEGDPDAEPATWTEAHEARAGDAGLPEDSEEVGDEADVAWTEFHTRARHKLTSAETEPLDHTGEDSEDDDSAEEDDDSGQNSEDELSSGTFSYGWRGGRGAGCEISDEGGCEHDGRELEQMPNDVPVLPVVTMEHNIFTDQRRRHGLSNLLTSFRTNGDEVRSADTGAVLVTRAGRAEKTPETPV